MSFSVPIDKALLAWGPRWSTLRPTKGAGFSSVGPWVPLDWHDPVLTWGGATVVARIVRCHLGSNREHVRRV
jgi:hypothetical protein